ncbi:MAG: hypothetical protein NTV58_06690 [Deltaproteobacteria bacterium]|nr:hypothetical protein [Deltaproteobacteria bacterium]
MAKIFFNNQEMTQKEMNRQVKERTDRTREVSRQESREGITTSSEDDLHFFKEQ